VRLIGLPTVFSAISASQLLLPIANSISRFRLPMFVQLPKMPKLPKIAEIEKQKLRL
jgi:hypothetical protein